MFINALTLALALVGLFASFAFVWFSFRVPGLGALIAGAGLLAALATLVRPRAGLYILVFSMLLSPAFSFGGVGSRAVEVRADDIFLLLIFIAWFTMATLRKTPLLGLKTPLVKPMIAYLLVAVVASLLGVMRGELRPLSAFFYTLKYAQYYMLYYMTFHLVDDWEGSRPFLFAGLATAVIVVLNAYSLLGRGMPPTCPFDTVKGVAETATLGGYLVIVCGVAGGVALYGRGTPLRGVLIALIFFCFPLILATTSRSSYMAAAVVVLAMIALGTGRRLILLTIVVCVGFLVLPFVFSDYMKLAKARIAYTFVPTSGGATVGVGGRSVVLESSSATRYLKWRQLYRDWLPNHPLVGHGVTGVGLVDTQIPLVLGETGMLGFLFWSAVLIGLFRRCFHLWKTTEDPLQRGMVYGFLCVYIGLLVQSIGVNTFIVIRMMEPFWFLAAVIMRIHSDEAAKAGRLEEAPKRAGALLRGAR